MLNTLAWLRFRFRIRCEDERLRLSAARRDRLMMETKETQAETVATLAMVELLRAQHALDEAEIGIFPEPERIRLTVAMASSPLGATPAPATERTVASVVALPQPAAAAVPADDGPAMIVRPQQPARLPDSLYREAVEALVDGFGYKATIARAAVEQIQGARSTEELVTAALRVMDNQRKRA